MAKENSPQADATPTDSSAREPNKASRGTSTANGGPEARREPLPPEVLSAKPSGDSLTWVLKGF